jgi:hypothetical protein
MVLLGHLQVQPVRDVWLCQLVSKSASSLVSLLMSVITVGESSSWAQELVKRASKLKVGSGFDPSTDV